MEDLEELKKVIETGKFPNLYLFFSKKVNGLTTFLRIFLFSAGYTTTNSLPSKNFPFISKKITHSLKSTILWFQRLESEFKGQIVYYSIPILSWSA